MKFIYVFPLLFLLACAPGEPEQKDSAASPPAADTPKPALTGAGTFDHEDADGDALMSGESLGGLRLGLPLKEAIALLGEPKQKGELQLWGADGEYHQTWTYKDVELDIIGEEGKARTVNMITILPPSTLKTKRGIGIGSSYEDVRAAYASEIDTLTSDSLSIVAGSIYGGVIFRFEKKKVASVFIGAAAE